MMTGAVIDAEDMFTKYRLRVLRTDSKVPKLPICRMWFLIGVA